MSLDEASTLAVAAINRESDIDDDESVKIAQITTDKKIFEVLNKEKIKQFTESAKTKYPKESK